MYFNYLGWWFFFKFQNILPKNTQKETRDRKEVYFKVFIVFFVSRKITQHFTKDELNWHPAILIHFCIRPPLSVHIDWNTVLCVLYKWLRKNDPAVQKSLQDNLTSASRSSVVERGRLSRTNKVAMTCRRWW